MAGDESRGTNRYGVDASLLTGKTRLRACSPLPEKNEALQAKSE